MDTVLIADGDANSRHALTGALGGLALFNEWPTPWSQMAALGLGGIALAVHSLKASLRVGSTVTTAGTANPALSVAEDATALGAGALALLLPVLSMIIVVLLLVIWLRQRERPRLPAS